MNMLPIVDRLEAQYQGQITFVRLDANSEEGRETFRYYGLPGHPSYILLNPAGEELWWGTGEQAAPAIEVEIDKYLP